MDTQSHFDDIDRHLWRQGISSVIYASIFDQHIVRQEY